MREQLEAAIDDNPYDKQAYAVLADHLQEIGDPRGQLIALQLASRSGAMDHTAAQYFDAHPEFAPPKGVEFGWACGYARSATIDDATISALRGTLIHPSARFLAELRLRGNLRSSIVGMVERAPRSLRVLHLHHQGTTILLLGSLLSACRRLVELDVQATRVDGPIRAPELLRLRVWSSLSVVKLICAADVPKLRWLSIRLVRENREATEAALRSAIPTLQTIEFR